MSLYLQLANIEILLEIINFILVKEYKYEEV